MALTPNGCLRGCAAPTATRCIILSYPTTLLITLERFGADLVTRNESLIMAGRTLNIVDRQKDKLTFNRISSLMHKGDTLNAGHFRALRPDGKIDDCLRPSERRFAQSDELPLCVAHYYKQPDPVNPWLLHGRSAEFGVFSSKDLRTVFFDPTVS